ncbi:MarR family winged helix-turn-helix transcriptional regulator [Actinomadura gamaensis]|uniref:MarR family winged helix-turn-helix transcriptional regulator n=1 Tax=Actinomadura gamaensis TaxID=1763541 RepID=A0ABV9TY25_9ACTN
MTTSGPVEAEAPASQRRTDLHWLAMRLFRGLGTVELEALRRHGLSLWGYDVLTEVADTPARTQLALGRALGLDKSKVVVVLDELESAGLVVRLPDPGDRRARIITATPEGRKVLASAAAELRSIEESLLNELGAEEGERLRATLAALTGGPLLRLRETHGC